MATSPHARTVVTELDKILSTPKFKASDRISTFLQFIVQEALEGRGDRLKGYAIGVQVFGRGESFDPQTDSIVRVEAGRLRRMLTEYYLTTGRNDPLRIVLPKGSYVPMFTPISQPIEEPPVCDASASSEPTAAAGATGVEMDPAALPQGPSIAVLAFDNLSDDPTQDFFCDGMSEEIITELTRFRQLLVIARNSSFQYKGRHVDVRQIGRDLNVRYVLEGSVRRAARAIRVSVQLLDATNGLHLWAERFERELTVRNVLDVQSSIAQHVVAQIADAYGVLARSQSSRAKRKRTDRLDAYEAVLRFYEFVAHENPETHRAMRDCLEQAVVSDPNYADAWAALAWVYGDEYRFGFNPRSELYNPLDKALEAAQRAVELEPRSCLAQQQLSLAHFIRGELDQFRFCATRALSLNPNNAFLVADIGVHMTVSGHWDEGISLMEKAIALNPVHPGWYNLPFFLDCYVKGDYTGALAHAEKVQLAGIFWSHAFFAMAYAQLGQYEAARSAVVKLLEAYPDFGAHVHQEMAKWNLPDAVCDKFIDGLTKAGLRIGEKAIT